MGPQMLKSNSLWRIFFLCGGLGKSGVSSQGMWQNHWYTTVNILELLSILSWPILDLEIQTQTNWKKYHAVRSVRVSFYPIDRNEHRCVLLTQVACQNQSTESWKKPWEFSQKWHVFRFSTERMLEKSPVSVKTSRSGAFRVSHLPGKFQALLPFFSRCFFGLFRNHLPKWSKENHVQQQLWIKSYVTTLWFIRFDSFPVLPSVLLGWWVF